MINGFSDLILERCGPEAGMHAREAPGVTSLPLGLPVTIAAKVGIAGLEDGHPGAIEWRSHLATG